MMHVLITGASGFIGQRVVRHLLAHGHKVSVVTRRELNEDIWPQTVLINHDIANEALPVEAFEGVELVLHMASEVIPSEPQSPLGSCPTVRMAQNLCADISNSSVKRLLVISSVYASMAEVSPDTARRYGQEKLAADTVILEQVGNRLPVVLLRPPAIYGPGAKGSLVALTKMIRKGIPLPLGMAKIARPYLSIGNLIDLIEHLIAAEDSTWHDASPSILEPHDGRLIATTELVSLIAASISKQPRLWPVPISLLRGLGRLTGKQDMISGAVDTVPIRYNDPLLADWGWRRSEERRVGKDC